MNYQIPTFLKWAGGKRRILDSLSVLLPKQVDFYFEPFLGGGSFFFYIKQRYNPKFATISDVNKDLISTYRAVRDCPRKIMVSLKYFKDNNSQDFYYKIRKEFNNKKIKGIKRCAAFIYLNKTCYNGLFRVNSKNEFNVPYGKYKNPEIFNQENILLASKLLKGVKIKCLDYRKIVKYVEKGNFVYLDPCYDPIKKTSFVNYTPKSFSENDRNDLQKFIKDLEAKKANILLSNNDIAEIRKMYFNFNIYEINAPRSISAQSSGRKKIIELAINNY